jgi:hypothetical protein
MALTLTVTDAGRAALRNAQGDGTNAVRIASVGVTATAFVSGGPLPAEIKRIATIAGGATSPDTIHVTVSDTGADVYSVRGFGFYLADGSLFASYGQANVIVEKSAQATMMLAVDVKFAAIDATQVTFGDSNFSNPAATTDTLGVVRLASDAEAITGTDTQKALTAKNLLAVLTDRLGAGAPSAFVKTLLTKASVLAFCTALGIRGAAQYDTGSGNGLDADLLDGKDGAWYQQWANLQGVPGSFPPSAHTHSAADITSGTLVVARGGTGLATIPIGAYLVGNGTNALQTKTAADVLTDIGAAPKAHSHPISDIIGLQTALDGKSTPASVSAQITTAVNALINGSPGALDTLKELADAMGDDPNFAATVTNALAGKLSLTGGNLSGLLGISGSGMQLNSGSYWATMRADPSGIVGIINKAGSTWNWSVDDNGNTSQRGSFNTTGGLHVIGGQTLPGTQGQGSYLSWNVTNGWGDMSFINHHGGGSGGWGFYDTDGTTYNRVFYIDRYGSITANAISSTGGTFTAPGNECDVAFNYNNSGANGYYLAANSGGFTICSKNSSGGYMASMLSCSPSNNQISAVGAVVANGGFQVGSDRRLKKNIRKREVLRGIALRCARIFREWELIANDQHDVGVVAQTLRRFAPWYVRKGVKMGKRGPTMLSVDKAGLALECSLDNALHLQDHERTFAALLRRIEKLEKAA